MTHSTTEPAAHSAVRASLETHGQLTLAELIAEHGGNPRHVKQAAEKLAAADNEPVIKVGSTSPGQLYRHTNVASPE